MAYYNGRDVGLRTNPEPPEDSRRVFAVCCRCSFEIYEGEDAMDLSEFKGGGWLCEGCMDELRHPNVEVEDGSY